MNRRQLLAALATAPVGATALAPIGAMAQTPPTIGVLTVADEFYDAALFRKLMQERGWPEQAYRLEVRSGRGHIDRLDALARELVAARVTAIVAIYTPSALAAKRATTTIPIVITAGDPVGTGVVGNLARPEGNITGVDNVGADLSGKRVEVLREVLPAMRRLGLLINPSDPFSKRLTEMTRDAATPFGITVDVIPAAADLEQAMRAVAAAGCEGVVVQQGLPQGVVGARLKAARMPAVSGDRLFVAAGGLLAVSTPFSERYRLLVQSLDKVLRGVQPRDLPVVQASLIHILVNRASARALGLTLPPLLLSRAEEIID
jgi:putative ABC transport system substrate-binding protein